MLILGHLSDLLLLGATIGLAIYCRRLTLRLQAFNDVDQGLGGTIAALSLQVDDLKDSIAVATAETDDRAARLDAVNTASDDRIGRMEMLLASLEELEQGLGPSLEDPVAEPPAQVAVPSFRAARAPGFKGATR